MKLCDVKQGEFKPRVSYQTKVHVPRSCFKLVHMRKSPKQHMTFVQAAVTAKECLQKGTEKKADQGKWAEEPIQLEGSAYEYEAGDEEAAKLPSQPPSATEAEKP